MARTAWNQVQPRGKRSVKGKGKYKAKASPYMSRALSRPGRITGLTKNDYGFPDRLSTKLIYADVITLTTPAGAGATQYYSFRMNSCYDPDLTSTGHQPQWWDQLTTVYNNYRVKGSKITATFSPYTVSLTGAVAGPYIVGITTSSTSTLSASSPYALVEDANGVNAMLGDKSGGNNIKTMSNTFSPLRDLGVASDDGDLSAVYNANPSRQFYAHVWCKDVASIVASVITVHVKLELQVEMFNRIEGVIS